MIADAGRAAVGTMPILPIVKRTVVDTTAWDVGKQIDFQSDGSSTSAGSNLFNRDLSVASRGRASDLGETPGNCRIRNTFIDMPVLNFTLLQGHQRSRRAWSCPAGGREAAEREELRTMEPTSVDDVPAQHFPVEQSMSRAYTTPDCQQMAPRPLALAELVGPQPHSQGSVLHFQGTCKPCAFFWKVVGCKYGTECEFCHLCDADERKRRNKEKRMAMHALQVGGRSHCLGAQPRHSRGSRLAVLGGA